MADFERLGVEDFTVNLELFGDLPQLLLLIGHVANDAEILWRRAIRKSA